MYKVVIEKSVAKFLEKHKGEKFIALFQEKLSVLSQNPYNNNLDVKAFSGSSNRYRLRIGKYRFLYEVNDHIITIFIFSADSRGGIYK